MFSLLFVNLLKSNSRAFLNRVTAFTNFLILLAWRYFPKRENWLSLYNCEIVRFLKLFIALEALVISKTNAKKELVVPNLEKILPDMVFPPFVHPTGATKAAQANPESTGRIGVG